MKFVADSINCNCFAYNKKNHEKLYVFGIWDGTAAFIGWPAEEIVDHYCTNHAARSTPSRGKTSSIMKLW